jgi:hypothetical protein
MTPDGTGAAAHRAWRAVPRWVAGRQDWLAHTFAARHDALAPPRSCGAGWPEHPATIRHGPVRAGFCRGFDDGRLSAWWRVDVRKYDQQWAGDLLDLAECRDRDNFSHLASLHLA